MKRELLERIVNAVLYEGYILYPYRPSSRKNCRERFTFGRVYPEAYSDAQKGAEPCVMQTECLVETEEENAELEVGVRFLHPMAREIGMPLEGGQREGESAVHVVPELCVDGQLYQSWHEAVEREIRVPGMLLGEAPKRVAFSFPEAATTEPIHGQAGRVAGVIARRQKAVSGTVELRTQDLGEGLHKVTVRILNQTPATAAELENPEAILMRTLASTHTILHVRQGRFVSLTAPPERWQGAAKECQNVGVWPVLVGDEEKEERDTVLSSPIILYDYPRIAAESAGPLFDGTEIDEILTLRILTMTEQEKVEMRRVDEQARRLLERTEALSGEKLLRLHGVMRTGDNPTGPTNRARPTEDVVDSDDFFGASTPLKGVTVGGVYLQAGDRVRIRPKARADALDLALAGQTAIIEAVEQDMERRIHLALVVENDPGKDLGFLRQPGHRFFYGVDEVEPLTGVEQSSQ